MDNDLGKMEPDDSPIADDEVPQEEKGQNLTVPKKGMAKTNEALELLGAGKEYPCNYGEKH